MIEVEKKFRPTEEQLQKLLAVSVFVKEKNIHDLYYDYSDYRLIKNSIRLRCRNDRFELKISDNVNEEVSGSKEIEDEEEIKKYFNITSTIREFVEKNMIEAINMKTNRREYKKDNFIIDIDELDFGYKCVEIELLVKEPSEVQNALDRIVELAKSFNFEMGEVPTKKEEYFRIVKPEVYKLLYPNN